jgi:hypothetical protein
MKLLDIPIGLLINSRTLSESTSMSRFFKNGISRMILPGANQTEDESTDIWL